VPKDELMPRTGIRAKLLEAGLKGDASQAIRAAEVALPPVLEGIA
jgi:hypothetical protein